MAACLQCPMVTATGRLNIPPDVLKMHPALEFLCPEHFKAFEALRAQNARLSAREAARVFCPCGNEIYLQRPGQPCQRCVLGLGPPPVREPDWSPSAVTGVAAPSHDTLPSCYGLSGTCPKVGKLYASGTWCEDHPPKRSW